MSVPFSIVLLIIFLILLILFIWYLLYINIFQPGAVYYPSKQEAIKEMFKIARVGKKDTILDVGSGDGRILIEAAKLGAKAIGYEIDPVLVWQSRKRIKEEGVRNQAKVYLKSFWHADFNQATVVTIYQFPKYMDKLQNILENKITHPIVVISNDYQFPRKKYVEKENKVYLYRFP